MDKLFFWICLLTIVPLDSKQIANYCHLCKDHTMCQFKEISQTCGKDSVSGVNATEAQEIVNFHNFFRAKIAQGMETRGTPGPQPSAANMNAFVWDNDLANVAQQWADQCILQHDKCRNDPRFPVGQNIFVATVSAKTDWRSAITTWYKEVAQFNSNTIVKHKINQTTANYTQLIWAKTRYIGCGQRTYGASYKLPESYHSPVAFNNHFDVDNDDLENLRGKRQDYLGFFGGASFNPSFAKGALGKYTISLDTQTINKPVPKPRPPITTTIRPTTTTIKSTRPPPSTTPTRPITTNIKFDTNRPPQQSNVFVEFNENRPEQNENNGGSFFDNAINAIFGINRNPISTTTALPLQPQNIFSEFYSDQYYPMYKPINTGYYPNNPNNFFQNEDTYNENNQLYPNNAFYPNGQIYYPNNPVNPNGGYYPDTSYHTNNNDFPNYGGYPIKQAYYYYPNEGFYPDNTLYPSNNFHVYKQQYYYPNDQVYRKGQMSYSNGARSNEPDNTNTGNGFYPNFNSIRYRILSRRGRSIASSDNTVVRTNPVDELPMMGRDQILVCNYGPAGNIADQPVYIAGKSCSQCPPDTICKNGLCF